MGVESLSNVILDGEDVLLYLDKRRTYLVRVRKGNCFHTHKGFIELGKLIGREYGTKIKSNLNVEFAALKPSLHDYVFKVQRKTQITYPKDAALILMFSGVGLGSRVVEAGTGTAALTISLAFHVRPDGHVYTYEIREDFVHTAQENLQRAKVQDYVTIKNQDVTQGIDETNIDAVILDLATPWQVVPHAYNALRGSGTLVSFSPTIEQVVKTVEALEEHSFVDINTLECLLRGMQIKRGKTRPHTLMTGHTGYLTYARKVFE